MNAEYTSDADLSDGTRDLVRQGLASVKRKRVVEPSQIERPPERLSGSNMDISHIRHPLCQNGLVGVVSTHGLNSVVREIGNDQNYNTINSLHSTCACVCFCVRVSVYVVCI